MLCVLPMKRGQLEVAGVRLTDPPSSSKILFAFTTPLSLVNAMARIHVRLLGPCFKTGRRGHRPTRQRDGDCNRALLAIRVSSITRLAQSQNIRGYKLDPSKLPQTLNWSNFNLFELSLQNAYAGAVLPMFLHSQCKKQLYKCLHIRPCTIFKHYRHHES